jgi:AcrR family transcriptional regulator
MESNSIIREDERCLAERIKDIAWEQISKSGPDALSLEEIGNSLKVGLQAVAEYYPNRDLLLTSLMLDSYASLEESLARAREVFPASGQFLQRLMAFCVTYRDWALRFPERYQLIFGPPVPGSANPRDVCRASFARTLSSLLDAIRDLRKTRMLNMDAVPMLPWSDVEWLCHSEDLTPKEELPVCSLALVIVGRLHGLVSLEINGPGRLAGDGAASLFDFEVKSMFSQFIYF